MKKTSRKKKEAPPPTTLGLTDKVIIFGFPIVILGTTTLLFNWSSIHRQTEEVSKTVEEWRSVYHLNSDQVERIKQIEFAFHGSGNKFSDRTTPTPQQNHSHHEQISKLMSAEDGEQFMHAMEGKASR